MAVYTVVDRAGGSVRVSLALASPRGDPRLCRLLSPYLSGPTAVLRGVRDPRSGERGTRVVALQPGSEEWLGACLRTAADELGLVVLEEER